MIYAERKIDSGDMRELVIYPVQPSGRLMPGSEPKTFGSREAQIKYNRKKAELELVRRVNANFNTGDIFMHLTYDDDNPCMPKDYDEARGIICAYLRRVRKWRGEHGMPEMKYIYVIEEQERKTGRYAGKMIYHYHLFMSAMPRDAAEDLWIHGERVNADRFQPWRFGQEAAARYMSKAPIGKKRFVCSRNCKKPVIHEPKIVNIGDRKMRSMAEMHIDDAAYWERRVPGYVFCGAKAVWNERNSRYYIRATFRRLEAGARRE